MEPPVEAFVSGDRLDEPQPATADRISDGELFDRLQNLNGATNIFCEVG